MAKKIVISFIDNPVVGLGFVYTTFLNGIPILYNSGQTSVSIEYLANGSPDEIPFKIELQTTLDATIDKTLAFLNANYVNDFVTYEKSGNEIFAIISIENVTVFTSSSNANIVITSDNVSDADNLNLKYFFQYTNVVNDTFLCRIFKKQYLGNAIEINGTATLEKGSVKNHTDSIRGTGLAIELEASLEMTLEDLYTENEQDFTVKFYKNNKLIFNGFLKPDGVYQSFVRDYWMLSLDCVDGLGALSNLSFVQESGFRFNGKMKASDIIYYCLKRTGIILPINTSINTLYDGLIGNDNLDILTKIYLNADRFFKNDSQGSGDGTLMSCEEVLKSVLDIFSACITQENGEWYIYKVNEIYRLPYVLFRRYNVNNVYIGNVTLNLNKSLGSQIENYYPHHSGGNQKIEMNGSISAFRMGYKYGFINGLLPNGKLEHDGNLVYSQWTKDTGANSFLINDPQNQSGVTLKALKINETSTLIMTSSSVSIKKGDLFDFKGTVSTYGKSTIFGFRIKLGAYYMLPTGEWTTTPSFFTFLVGNEAGEDGLYNLATGTIKQSSYPSPIDGNLIVEIYRPVMNSLFTGDEYIPIVKINSVDITTNSAEISGKVGEFHTVSRTVKVSSIVKENKSVSNGDETDNFYSGTIFKEDSITPTETWSRKGSFESYPLLRIAAEDELRLGQKPLKVFSGNIFGFLPYLSFLQINSINGRFFPIEYSYDTVNNQIKLKVLELYAEEIPDIMYKFSFDYGSGVVKPTIQG